MYVQKNITTRQIVSIWQLRKEQKTIKEIAHATGVTPDKANWIIDHLRRCLQDKILPRKKEYADALYAILKDEGREADFESFILTPRGNTTPYTTDQLVNAYRLRQGGESYNQIAKKTGIKEGSVLMILLHIDMFFSFPERYERASETYRRTIDILKGNSLPQGTQASEVTTTDIVKIWQLRQGVFSHRRIAEALGWTEKGATERVRQILRNLDFYLAENTFQLIQGKKKPYREAREIILNQIQDKLDNKEISLSHKSEGDIIIAIPSSLWPDEAYELTMEEKLKDASRMLKKAVNQYIEDAIGEVKQPQLEDIITLQTINDEGNIGYLLTDIESYLSDQEYSQFLTYHEGKTGGIYQGKYYVLKDDFERFLQARA